MEESVTPEISSNPDKILNDFRAQRASSLDWQDLISATQRKLSETLQRGVSHGVAEAYLALSNIAGIIGQTGMMTATLRGESSDQDLRKQIDSLIDLFSPQETKIGNSIYLGGVDIKKAREVAQPIKSYLCTLSERGEISQHDFDTAKEVVTKALLFPPLRSSSKPEDQKWRSIRNDLMRSTNYPSPLT